MEKILKAEGLTRAFENKGERFLAVRDVSFSLYRGEALGIELAERIREGDA